MRYTVSVPPLCAEWKTSSPKFWKADFQQVGGLGDPPTNQKIGLCPHFLYYFASKMLILWFSCNFWPFCPKFPPPSTLVETKWENSSCHRYSPRVAYYVPCQKGVCKIKSGFGPSFKCWYWSVLAKQPVNV